MSAAAIRSFPASNAVSLNQRTWLTVSCLGVSDLLAASAAVLVTLLAANDGHMPIVKPAEFLIPVCSLLATYVVLGLYPIVGISPAQEFRRILIGSAIAYAIVGWTHLMETGDGVGSLARVALAAGMTFALVLLGRATVRKTCGTRGWWGTSTVIFGSGPHARAIFRLLQRNPGVGLKVRAVCDDQPANWPELEDASVHRANTHEGLAFAEFTGIDHAIIAMRDDRRAEVQGLIRYQSQNFKHILVVPDLANICSLWVEPRDLGGVLALHVSQALWQPGPRILKRTLDILISGLGILAALPLLAALCLAVRLGSPGPVFYSQPRVGRNNKLVKVWKFRTMRPNGDEILRRHLDQNPGMRAEWERDRKLKRDPRVTSVGRILRKTSLDELPQLWCVLMGGMSLVGPRPIVTSEIPRYGEHFQAYAAVRPGITGMWQISGRNNTSYDERVQFDEYYVRNWSVWLDLYIITQTIRTVLAGDGAY